MEAAQAMEFEELEALRSVAQKPSAAQAVEAAQATEFEGLEALWSVAQKTTEVREGPAERGQPGEP